MSNFNHFLLIDLSLPKFAGFKDDSPLTLFYLVITQLFMTFPEKRSNQICQLEINQGQRSLEDEIGHAYRIGIQNGVLNLECYLVLK